MLKQKQVLLLTSGDELSYSQFGDIIVEASSSQSFILPSPLPGLWYRLFNFGEDEISVEYNSNTLATLKNSASAIFLASPNHEDIWYYFNQKIPAGTIKEEGPPTENTVGEIGQLYLDLEELILYYCSSIVDEEYFWEEIATIPSGESLVINSNHIFADETERDLYFLAHPEEQKRGIFISVDEEFQQWDGTEWLDKTAVITGPVGPQGLPGIGVPIIWRGEWSNSITYNIQDGVSYEGSSYVSKIDNNIGNLPTDVSKWFLIASRGGEGPKGETGETPFSYELQPQLVMAVSHITTSSSVTIPSFDWEVGDYLVMSVLHRSNLTIPTGWTLLSTVGPHISDSLNQRTSVLYRIAENSGSGTQLVQQAASGRIGASICVFRGATGIRDLPDYAQNAYKGNTLIPVSPKPSHKTVIYSISASAWSGTTNWRATPGMPVVAWPTATSTNVPALGVFIDSLLPVAHTLIGASASDGFVGLIAIELDGTLLPFRGEEGKEGKEGQRGPAGVGVPILWKDLWDEEIEYDAQDGINYEGSSYVSLSSNNINHLPTDPVWWFLIAAHGAQGIQGIQGVQGIQGIQGIQGPVGPAQPRPIDIKYYSDGFIVTFADETVGDYSWIRDGQGRITNLTRVDKEESMTVSYSTGPKP